MVTKRMLSIMPMKTLDTQPKYVSTRGVANDVEARMEGWQSSSFSLEIIFVQQLKQNHN